MYKNGVDIMHQTVTTSQQDIINLKEGTFGET